MGLCSQAKAQNYSERLEDFNMHTKNALFSTSAMTTDILPQKKWPLMTSKHLLI
jgi:hypothetical protein